MSLLSVNDLVVKFSLRKQAVTALNGISFKLEKGKRLGVVGESGAGKSITGFSILNLISKPGFIDSGQIMFDGNDIIALDDEGLRKLRGNRIAMIFQDPMVTLNPVLTIGQQMVETLQAHRKLSTNDAQQIAIEKLKDVYIPSPEERLQQYPHELSGGMRQRIIIAIALLLDPEIIIADEPTTALDVTIQADIMELLVELCENKNLSLILITHDLAVVSQMTDEMLVLYAGRVVESGVTRDIIDNPKHPYTQGLINALPQQTTPGQRLNQIRGSMPSLGNIPSGCPFNPRCDYISDKCKSVIPQLSGLDTGQTACHTVERLGRAVEIKDKTIETALA